MALSIIEEIQIIKGSYSPKLATLSEIVEQSATGQIDDFYTNVKEIDEASAPLAAMYKTKMLGFISVVANQTSNYTMKIIRIVISNLAATAVTIADVNSATDDQWVDFVEAEMMHSLEILAGVLPEEKAQYDAYTTTTTIA